MSKRKKHKLLFPPRYPRGDPRNMERQDAARERQRQDQYGTERKLRSLSNDGCFTVTVPPWIVEWLGIVKGDSIAFHKTRSRGVVTIIGVKNKADTDGRRREY